jgi:hypothetical protein
MMVKSMEVAQGLEGNRYTYWVLGFVEFCVSLTASWYIHVKKNQLDAQFIFSIFRQTPPHVSDISTAHHQEVHRMDTTIGTFLFCLKGPMPWTCSWRYGLWWSTAPDLCLSKVSKANIKRLGAVLHHSPYNQHRHLKPLVSVQAQAREPWACLWHWCVQKMNSKYQLLYPYGVPPDDGLYIYICSKHVEVFHEIYWT